MKLLYAHDHIFSVHNNDYYSNGSFSTEVLQRYTDVFGEMKFLSRQTKLNSAPKNLTLASHKNVQFVKVPNVRSLKKISNYFEAVSIIKKEVVMSDCIIARLPSSIGELTIKFAKKYNKPYLIEVVGCAWDSNYNYGSLFGKINAPIEYLINKTLIKKAPYVIYITRNFLQNRYPTTGKSTVCPNVNIEQVELDVLKRRIQKIEHITTPLKFGLIGSLNVDYKGHDTVIKCLGILKNELPPFQVEFLGKGNSNRWNRLINENGLMENINFVGTLPSGDEVYKWLDNIDVILQPSYAEAQGRSIIEAMSRGCLVISSKVGGIKELMDDEWLIHAGDYKDLAKKIQMMLSDSNVQKSHAKINFNKSKVFYKHYINEERTAFLEQFKKSVW